MRHFSLTCATALLLLAGATAFTLADDVYLKKGKISGRVVSRENGRITINVYNSPNTRMTRGREVVDENQVKKITDTRSGLQRYLDDLLERVPPGSEAELDDLVVLLDSAQKLGEKEETERLAFEILRLAPDHAAALKVIPAPEWKRRKKADPRTNPELASRLEAWFKLEKAAARKAEHSAIQYEFGLTQSFTYMERVRRSRTQPTGRRNDVLLTLNSKTDKGVYTVYVPNGYDPMRSWPLVLGLHGGGPDGKDRKDVVGSGRSAMNFYAEGAARRGYLVVCPTAIQAPWSARVNDSFVRSCLEEIQLLFNVDLNRVYLTGHSMGGFGTWVFGPRYPHLWAVVAPMAGGGFRGLGPFEKTSTPIYLYHGADDRVVGPANSRQAADAMRGAGHDFIYTEIPDSGHGFPADVREEMWHMFETRRLAVAPKRARKGRFVAGLDEFSSFNAAVSKAERLYFGAPGTELPDDKNALLARLKLGGGGGLVAAARLSALKDESIIPKVAKVLTAGKGPLDTRRQAAGVLGEMRSPKGVKALLKALKSSHPDLIPALAEALGKIAERSAGKPLAAALGRMDREFDDRLQGKRMAFSDWQRMLNAEAALCRALTIVGDATAAKAVRTSARKILCTDWEVRESDRAGLDKKAPLAPCAVAMLDALGAVGKPSDEALIKEIVDRYGSLKGVAAAAAAASDQLKKNETP